MLFRSRGERCLRPPPGVGGALAGEISVPSFEAAMDGPASGDERSGRERCEGESEPSVVECRRVGTEGRAGMVSRWSAEGKRGGERVTVEGATSIGVREEDG